MEISSRVVGNVQVVTVTGSVDAGTADKFDKGLLPLAEGEHPQIAVEMTGLSYMSSAGLRILLAAQKAARKTNGEVVLVGMPEPVQEVFSMVGFDVLFRAFPDLDQAIEAFGQSE